MDDGMQEEDRHTEATPQAPPPQSPRRRLRLPVVDTARCTGCGRCVGACAPQLLSLAVMQWKKTAVLHGAEHCTGCSLCALRCPFDAISMQAPALR